MDSDDKTVLFSTKNACLNRRKRKTNILRYLVLFIWTDVQSTFAPEHLLVADTISKDP